MDRRVVVTGIGIITSNAHGKAEFSRALREGISGIRHYPALAELNFACQVGGKVEQIDEISARYFREDDLIAMNETMRLSGIAAMDAWTDAGLEVPAYDSDFWHQDTGCIVGTGITGLDTLREKVMPRIDEGKVKRLGSAAVEQVMGSAISAKLSGLLALGNLVTSNSSACNTGTEAIVESYWRIRTGRADRMLAGGAEGSSVYCWGGFDAMKVTNSRFNDLPAAASRPMSASAAGFVPGSGAGILLLESLESALQRNAHIYAEIIGGEVNCGGQRKGGSMTAPNHESVQNVIRQTLAMSGIRPDEIDLINGHLTATFADPYELRNWSAALGLSPDRMPAVQSTKSLIGHGLASAGGMEAVAVMLQMDENFVHGSINCEDLHPEIVSFANSVVHQTVRRDVNIVAKASFGFGDVNGCLIFRKYK